MLVSTLICTYNAENTIHWALQSVMDQTYENQEILILDNDSKDNTLHILKDYQKKDKRIKIFSLWKNLWPYKWLNYLLDQSKWKYIAIQDHDDIRHPEKLKKQVEFLEKNPRYIWCWTWWLNYYAKSKIWYTFDDFQHDDNRANHTSLIFFNTWKKYDTSIDYLCDLYFMKIILCNKENRIYIIPDILTLHYEKENGWNYSSYWFNFNKKTLKRHFDVFWFSVYHNLLIIYLCIQKILPKKINFRLENFLTKNIKKARDIGLYKDKNISVLLNYLK